MITIHPEFDGQWFTRDEAGKIIQAPTLRLLKEKLGKGYRIKDYYPNGYHKRTIWSEPVRSAIEPLQYNVKTEMYVGKNIEPEPPPPIPPPVVVKKRKRRTYDHERILDLWSQGWQAPQIAKLLGIPQWTRVGGIVSRYRHLGDPRAAPRTTNPNWRPNNGEPKRLLP